MSTRRNFLSLGEMSQVGDLLREMVEHDHKYDYDQLESRMSKAIGKRVTRHNIKFVADELAIPLHQILPGTRSGRGSVVSNLCNKVSGLESQVETLTARLKMVEDIIKSEEL